MIMLYNFMCLLFFNYCFSQTAIEKVKIGKYSYNIYNKSHFEYELNKISLVFLISLNNKEFDLGKYLSYKLTDKPNLIGIGKLKIDKKNKNITCVYKSLEKDNDETFDSIVYINKQKKDGSFYKISIVEYHNGVLKKIK